jgi:general secretion pathway protein L
MSALRTIIAWLSRWIDDVARALTRFGGVFRYSRKVQLVEQADGAFVVRLVGKRSLGRPVGEPLRIEEGAIAGTVLARADKLLDGGQIEIVLRPSRFVFRPLELPRRAGEFLDGVVRAQIDRLTPWTAADAAFGWSEPTPVGADKIVITVAATARAMIAPIVQALAARRADSIRVSTLLEAADAPPAPITIFTQQSGAEQRVRRLRRKLIAVLALTFVTAAGGVAAAIFVGGDLDAQQLDLARRIAERRAALLSGRGSLADEALAALDARKRATPAGVIVLEALSQTLPDDTYLNELRIEDGKVQIAGLTRDAPELIRLIEQSQHFTRATFFAPTTNAPADSAERFHIEAHIEPVSPASP